MRPWPRSLQGRLLLLVLGVVAAVWLAAAARTWYDVRHELDELLDAHLAQAAALLVVQQAGDFGGEAERTLDAPSLHKYAPRAMFQVFHEGRLVMRSADAPRAPLLPLDARREGERKDGRRGRFADVRLDGVAWRVFATRGAEHDVRVYVAERSEARASIVWAALRATLAPLALALPLLGALVWAAVYRTLAPLRALRAQLAARAPGSLEPLQLGAAPAEVTPLVDALDALFVRIAGLLDAERRFTADAAHELRTPIAAIRAQAQVALGAEDDAERRHALQATLQGCDRAARLVEQLLTLARVEAGAAVQRQAVDLAALTRAVVGELAPQAAARAQELGFEAQGRCMWTGDATLLAALVRNLVDNALRYSPPGARIAVALRAGAGGVTLTVEDSGPGLDADERARLGRERFRRGAGQDAAGSGLGWSIVRRIAAVHALDVTLAPSAALGGLAVQLTGRAAH
ncbi:MAG: histidine kinase dimerization/phospho-acceptor domain-containing protein [Rubrivivax sp.]